MEFGLTEDQLQLQKTMRDFAQREIKPLVQELDTAPEGYVDWNLIRKAGEIGLFSGWLPREYGGSLSGIRAAIVAEELSAVDVGVFTLLAASGLGIVPVAIAGD